MTPIPKPSPTATNLLGKTALWVNLGGLVAGGTLLVAAYLMRSGNRYEFGDEYVVGGMGVIVLVVSWLWSLVLVVRSKLHKEPGSHERTLLMFLFGFELVLSFLS